MAMASPLAARGVVLSLQAPVTCRKRQAAVSAAQKTVAPALLALRCSPAAPHPRTVAMEPLRPMQSLCQALDRRTARQYINQLQGWELQEDAAGALHLRRTWLAASFAAAVELCSRIAAVAADEGRDADARLSLSGWNRVTASLWTDVRKGVTERDFVLASKLEKMSKDGLLRCPQPKLPTSA